VVVDDFDAIDIQYNFFIAHGLCLYDQMKISGAGTFIWQLLSQLPKHRTHVRC
jgi:hypothetical protein